MPVCGADKSSLEANQLALAEDNGILELVVRIGVRPQVVEALAELLTAGELPARRLIDEDEAVVAKRKPSVAIVRVPQLDSPADSRLGVHRVTSLLTPEHLRARKNTSTGDTSILLPSSRRDIPCGH